MTNNHPKFSGLAESYKETANWMYYVVFKRNKFIIAIQQAETCHGKYEDN